MNSKQQIIEEIEQIPEPLLNEIVDFIQFLKQKHLSQNKLEMESTNSLETALLYEKREVLLDELEKQNQDLNDYAHMVSHDLKSPLRSIHALTVWINEDYKDKLDDAGRQNLDLIRNNVEKMESLINGILNYSEIADIELKNSEIDTNKLVKDVLEIVHKPKNISINIKVSI